MAPGEMEALEDEFVSAGVEGVETVSVADIKSSLLQLIWIMGAIMGSVECVAVDEVSALVLVSTIGNVAKSTETKLPPEQVAV